MVKISGISVLRVDHMSDAEPVILCQASDFSELGFFQRGPAKEFLVFFSKTVGKRVGPMQRMQVNEGNNTMYAHSMAGGKLVVCVVTDKEYPSRVAFDLANNVGTNFQEQFRGRWEACEKDNMLSWPELESTLAKWQNPQSVDKISMIKNNIDETKVVMCEAIDQALARGEKVDDLVARSADLSASSKQFYTSSKKLNSCCAIG